MKRNDFFKILGTLVIAPFAVKGVFTDNKCPEKPTIAKIETTYKYRRVVELHFEREIPDEFYMNEFEHILYINDILRVNGEDYMVTSSFPLNDQVHRYCCRKIKT